MSATPTPEDQLSDRQREVLALVREGKNPTEVGKALDISSQAVHGHLRRLRGHGLIPDEPTRPGRAAARSRATPRNGRFNAADALAAVHAAAREQDAQIEARLQEIAAEITTLKGEEKDLKAAREELRKHLPSEPEA